MLKYLGIALLVILAICAVAIKVYRPNVDDGPAFDTGDIRPALHPDQGIRQFVMR